VSAPAAPAEPAAVSDPPLNKPAPPPPQPARRGIGRVRAVRVHGGGLWSSALLVAVVLAWVAFYARGGLNL